MVPVGDAGADQTVDEGDTVSFDGTGSQDPDGSIASYIWDFADAATADGATATHVYDDNGVFVVILTVTDDEDATATDTVTVTVNNVDPTVEIGQATVDGLSVDVAFAFTDPGASDTHTAFIDWGDGTQDDGLVTASAGSGTVTGSHVYAEGGSYLVKAGVFDDDSGLAANEVSVFVAPAPTHLLTSGDLPAMVLSQADVRDEFLGLLFSSAFSGFADNAAAADGTFDPDDTAEDLAARGRMDEYVAVFTAGVEVSSGATLYATPELALGALQREIADFGRFQGSDIGGAILEEFQEESTAPDVGTGAVAGRLTLAIGAQKLYIPFVKWTNGPVVATVQVNTTSDADISAETGRLAVRMQGVMDDVPRPGPYIVFESNRGGDWEVYGMDEDGAHQTNLTKNSDGDDRSPAWSPDGSKIAFATDRDGNFEIYVMDADGLNQTRLTDNSGIDSDPAWSPDGTKIAFASDVDGNDDVWVMDADGANQTRLTVDSAGDTEPTWSPDGTLIAFSSVRDGNPEIYVMSGDGSNPARFTDNPAVDGEPDWSAEIEGFDFIVFSSDRDGQSDLYVTASVGGENRLADVSSSAGDAGPSWSADGSELAFSSDRDGNMEIYVFDVHGFTTRLTDNAAQDMSPDWSPALPERPYPTSEIRLVPSTTLPPVPAPVTSRVGRLAVALSRPSFETNLPWAMPAPDLIQLRPMMEYLVDIDRETGRYVSMLAKSWEVSADARVWTFHLRQGVPFQSDWGAFTAEDVRHSMAMLTRQRALQSSDKSFWLEILDRIDVLDNSTVRFILNRAEPELDRLVSAWSRLVMLSKAQWDAVGDAGLEIRPAGTGPYEYGERTIDQGILFERVPDHWRRPPDFEELQLSFIEEESTRLAALLVGQAHIVESSPSLTDEAVVQGMKLIASTQPARQEGGFMGGLYFATLDDLEPSVPWVDPRVRQAMNLAIDRNKLNYDLYGGRGELMPVFGFHPSLPGWNTAWELYPYDPDKARQLLDDANRSDGFEFKMYATGEHGVEVSEALAAYFMDIGLSPVVDVIDDAPLRDKILNREMHGAIWGLRTSYLQPHEIVGLFNDSAGAFHTYEDPAMDTLYEVFLQETDLDRRAELQQLMGDHKSKNYAEIPLFWLNAEAVVNPDIVAGYSFPGFIPGSLTHLEYVVPVPL